jgi:hypothetical protein
MPSPAARLVQSFALFLVCITALRAQPPRIQHFEYIDRFAEEAVHQMALYRIPASVILAQAIFESGSGSSELARRSNNHFGIKCHSQWTGDTVVKHDDALNECFRSYRSIQESYTDHSIFLVTRRWYAPLFKLSVTDYKGWCKGLKAAGYATYKDYAEELIRIIEQNRLYELDGTVRLAPRLTAETTDELRSSNLTPAFFCLKDFAKNGALFTDEKDLYLRSLDLIIELPVEIEVVAGR